MFVDPFISQLLTIDQTSQAFFSSEKSFFKVTQALDATCQVNRESCTTIMSKYATQLKSTDNCGADYQQQNPIVTQAYEGLVSYSVMYQAGCLKSVNGSYCFADAITGISPVADSYLYYLPLGTGLPINAKPSCSYCVQNIMSLYQGAASSSSQPVSKTYKAASQQINNLCGSGFVNPTVKSSANRFIIPLVPSLLAILVGFLIT
jgi:hypothetical protein